MSTLTVLYDGRCGLCCRAREWLEKQPKYVELGFVPAGSLEAQHRFPGLDAEKTLQELTVVGPKGEVYYGAKAWVMCLWALRRFRGLALRLGSPEQMGKARWLVARVSRNRHRISGMLGLGGG